MKNRYDQGWGAVELTNVTYQGPPIDDPAILDRLPADYRGLLTQINGFIQFGGGLHIRGACTDPSWHSLTLVWGGELALYKLYPRLRSSDVPFGQDALGDQFFLRDGGVYRLSGETGTLEPLDCGLFGFLDAAQADPVEYLGLHPLIRFYNEGGSLEPGQLLSAYPPFCTREAASGVSLKAVPAAERIAFLAHFAAQITNMTDGQKVAIN